MMSTNKQGDNGGASLEHREPTSGAELASKGGSESDLKELEQLERKYKIMMGDRKSFQKHSKPKLRQQSERLERLKTENQELKTMLKQADPQAKNKPTDPDTHVLNGLFEEEKKLIKLAGAEKTKGVALDRQVKFLEKKITSIAGIPRKAQERMKHMQRQVNTLEDKLEKATVRYNQAIVFNKNLRSDIDDLWVEKKRHQQVIDTKSEQINQLKSTIGGQIHRANDAYELRDRHQKEIELIKQQIAERESLWEQELKLLEGKMACFPRVDVLLDRSRRGDMGMEEEASLRSQVTQTEWKSAAAHVQLEIKRAQTQEYEDTVQRLLHVTGEESLDGAVGRILAAEERTYREYSVVNHLVTDTETLEEGLKNDRRELEPLMDQAKKVVSASRRTKEQLGLFEERLAKQESVTAHYELLLEPMQKEMDELMVAVEEVHKQFKCEPLGVEVGLVACHGIIISEKNMLLHLGLFEQRALEIMHAYLRSQPRGSTFLTQADDYPNPAVQQPSQSMFGAALSALSSLSQGDEITQQAERDECADQRLDGTDPPRSPLGLDSGNAGVSVQIPSSQDDEHDDEYDEDFEAESPSKSPGR